MTNKTALQISIMALIMTSTSMLAMSIGRFHLVPIALLAIIVSFLITDLFKWVAIDGWIANIISLTILFFAMRDFVPGDSANKLISVANLLVYLQCVLLFQKKTPRLTWQIMVLSLLQVVITTIFSVNFEGGLLFVLFFVSGGCALALQNIFANEYEIEKLNEFTKRELDAIDDQSETSRLAWWKNSNEPIPSFDREVRELKFSPRVLSALPGVMFVSAIFTSVLFLTAPRQVQPWFSPITYKVSSTGITKSVDLEETGKISLSTARVLRATFSDIRTKQPIQLGSLAYFRGIALSRLILKDGKTSWQAPYDRVSNRLYEGVPQLRGFGDGSLRAVNVEVTMEQTADPMLYMTSPVFLAENTSANVNFCHEISAFTRCRENEKIDVAPYTYEFLTVLENSSSTAPAWPYKPNSSYGLNASMDDDRAQYRTLTEMDPARYPRLVEIANSIARQVERAGGGRRELVRKIEDHFLSSGNYAYTLDYTDVERDTELDPVEDFVRNTKTGHCETYASAMTLMLRSLGIPARLVVGFHGGDFDSVTQAYTVRGTHAHAWVEVYLTSDDCQQANLNPLFYNSGGAWLTADPTPGQSDLESGLGTDGAIELARTVWQDYVLGMEDGGASNREGSLGDSLLNFLDGMNLDQVPSSLRELQQSKIGEVLLPTAVTGVVLFGLFGFLRLLIRRANYADAVPQTAVGRIRRFVADAIGLISSDLREWVIGQDPETAFYRRMVDILEAADFRRQPSETHREFANKVATNLASHPSRESISATVREVTEAFNATRFGGQTIDEVKRSSLSDRLNQLKTALKN